MDTIHPLSLPDPDFDPMALRRPLVAVLPFTAAEGDEELRLLGSELADAVREALGQVPVIGAILISSEFLERAPDYAVELICRQLRVGHLVAGHCHRTEGAASLYLELTDTREWHVRWAQFFRGNALSLLREESGAMAALQSALQAALTARRPR